LLQIGRGLNVKLREQLRNKKNGFKEEHKD